MQATSAPARTLDQRKAALRRANVIRTARGDWKKQVKRREINPLGVLQSPPAEFETMKVFDVLIAMPKYGRVKTNKVLQLARISPSKTLDGLTERQRNELLSMLRWR